MTTSEVHYLAKRFQANTEHNERPIVIRLLIDEDPQLSVAGRLQRTAYNAALFLHYLDDGWADPTLVPTALNLLQQAAETAPVADSFKRHPDAADLYRSN